MKKKEKPKPDISLASFGGHPHLILTNQPERAARGREPCAAQE